jgi:hemolysin III
MTNTTTADELEAAVEVKAKPQWRGWLHLIWFEASLIAGTALIVTAHGATGITAAAVYAASVSGLFGTSALYHRGNWRPGVHKILKRADHFMIYVMIAGTTTPIFLIAAPQPYGLVCLIVMWSLMVVAAAVHQFLLNAPDWIAVTTFVALGVVSALALPAIWVHVGVAAGLLTLGGGLLYIVGGISFQRKKPDPSPSVFGFHEVFHAWVCAAATCHYTAIFLLVA